MKYGVYVANFGPYGDARTLAKLAQLAEEAGWDGFFIWEHLARPFLTDVADPWIALSAAAMATHRIRLGALVTPLARRRPWKVARESATLDRLSNGRLILGVGLGSSGGADVEWGNFGEEMDLRKRAGMLDEGLEIIAGLWSGEPFSFSGRYYTVKESRFLPVPLQAPRIPVWVAGYWPHQAPFRRMARWDGMVPQFSPADYEDETELLAQAVKFTLSQRHNGQPFDVVCTTAPLRRSAPEQAASRAAAWRNAGATWLLEEIYPQYFGAGWQAAWPLDEMERYVAQGPPQV